MHMKNIYMEKQILPQWKRRGTFIKQKNTFCPNRWRVKLSRENHCLKRKAKKSRRQCQINPFPPRITFFYPLYVLSLLLQFICIRTRQCNSCIHKTPSPFWSDRLHQWTPDNRHPWSVSLADLNCNQHTHSLLPPSPALGFLSLFSQN